MRALEALLDLGVSAAKRDWVGAVTSLVESRSQDTAATAQQSVRDIVDLRIEMSDDGKPMCGRPTSLLKVYGPDDLPLKSFRVSRIGPGVLSEGQLAKLVGRIGGPSAAGNSMEAWRAFLTDGYVWLSSSDEANGQTVLADTVEDETGPPDSEFAVPAGRIAYNGRGIIAVSEWKNWFVDDTERKCAAYEQPAAHSGQHARGGLTLKCAGGNKRAHLVIRLKSWRTQKEVEKKRIEQDIEMLDGETQNQGIEFTLLKVPKPYRDEFYVEVTVDGKVVSSAPSDYRLICNFTE